MNFKVLTSFIFTGYIPTNLIMSGYVDQVTEIINQFLKGGRINIRFDLQLQGVAHMYTQYEDGIIKEFYSCSFIDLKDDPTINKINTLYNDLNTTYLQQQGLTIRNVSYVDFNQTKVGPGKRYQAQFTFRGY